MESSPRACGRLKARIRRVQQGQASDPHRQASCSCTATATAAAPAQLHGREQANLATPRVAGEEEAQGLAWGCRAQDTAYSNMLYLPSASIALPPPLSSTPQLPHLGLPGVLPTRAAAAAACTSPSRTARRQRTPGRPGGPWLFGAPRKRTLGSRRPRAGAGGSHTACC